MVISKTIRLRHCSGHNVVNQFFSKSSNTGECVFPEYAIPTCMNTLQAVADGWRKNPKSLLNSRMQEVALCPECVREMREHGWSETAEEDSGKRLIATLD